MPIHWNAESRELHLDNGRISYLLGVLENGALGHLYAGPSLVPGRSYRHLAGPTPFRGFSNRLGDPVALEYPTAGRGDYRMPALEIEQADGATALELVYVDHHLRLGKPSLPGLPATYTERDDEAETAVIVLRDAVAEVEVDLLYTIFTGLPAIARSARIRNTGARPLRLRTVMSASLDLPDADWELAHLSGAWARERHLHVRRLSPGSQSIESRRGISSHEQSPFLLLRRPCTTEALGDAIGCSLVYSGNFLAEAEVDPFGTTRVRLGINPHEFCWTLEPGDTFTTPEAILVFSDAGLGDLSDTFHRLYRERLARGVWRDRPRPVLLNSWEGTYFDFDEARLLAMARAARELGVELFVLDDGWFGHRDADTSSLGDWSVDPRKLPSGLDHLAQRVEALGMRFGLWIEPEMVSRESQLFATHPDWAVGIPGRERTEGRHQFVLDLSRPQIVEYLYETLATLLRSAPISYVKWDMNRAITEPYSLALSPDRQGEFFHRYTLGVYALYERLTATFPEILFESCASGGGRFDPGMLAYAPQAWTSDDTDAVERLRIQWGTSLVYPPSAMAAHVSAVPNHQTGRLTPLATRAAVAFFGVFGYELDPTRLRPDERREVADQVAFYRRHRELLQRGRFVRLRSPFEGTGNETAWLAVSDDRRHAIVGHYTVLATPNPGPARLRLRGLDPDTSYQVTPWPSRDDTTTRANAGLRGGDELMQAGLLLATDRSEVAAHGDFRAQLYVLEAVPDT